MADERADDTEIDYEDVIDLENQVDDADGNDEPGDADRADELDSICLSNFLGSGECRIGLSSEVEFSDAYLKRLEAFIRRRSVRRLFYAPCGGMN